MTSMLRERCRVSRSFREKLLSTGNALLLHSVEDTAWGIGVNTCDIGHPLELESIHGSNNFGKLLMAVRDEYLSESMPTTTQEQQAHVQYMQHVDGPSDSDPALRYQQSTSPHGPPKVIIMGSSNIKYVNPDKCFGTRTVSISRQSTAQMALRTLHSEIPQPSVEYFVLHVGLNDLREGRSVGEVQGDIDNCLMKAAELYPKAQIAYCELLHLTHDDQLNLSIDQLNIFCQSLCAAHHHLVYVDHPDLQRTDNMYDDNVHINSTNGIRSFIRYIYTALNYGGSRRTIQPKYVIRNNNNIKTTPRPDPNRQQAMHPRPITSAITNTGARFQQNSVYVNQAHVPNGYIGQHAHSDHALHVEPNHNNITVNQNATLQQPGPSAPNNHIGQESCRPPSIYVSPNHNVHGNRESSCQQRDNTPRNNHICHEVYPPPSMYVTSSHHNHTTTLLVVNAFTTNTSWTQAVRFESLML